LFYYISSFLSLNYVVL